MEIQSKIIDDKYYLNEKVGSGGTSDVYLGHSKTSDTKVAIKILKHRNEDNIHQFEQEINLLSKLKHKNIIKVIEGGRGFIVKKGKCSEKKYYLIIEYAAKQELFNYIFYPKKPFDESKAKYIFLEILNGLEACHIAGIIHGNLKIKNIMLDSNWNVKISNFGSSSLFTGKENSNHPVMPNSSTKFEAPEIRRRKPCDGIKADIFSLGVILFVLVNGNYPFHEAIPKDPLYKFIAKNDFNGYWQRIEKSNKNISYSAELKELINKMLSFDFNQRPGIDEIKKHIWFHTSIASEYDLKEDFEKREDIMMDRRQFEEREDSEDEAKNSTKVYRSHDDTLLYFKSGCVYRKIKEKEMFPVFNLKRINPIRFMNDLVKFYIKNEDRLIEIDEKKLEFTITFENQGNESQLQSNEINEKDKDNEVIKNNEEIEDSEPQILKIKLKMYQIGDNIYQLQLMKKSGDHLDFVNSFIDINTVIKAIISK